MKRKLLLMMWLVAPPVWAGVPQQITYQGTLKQSSAAANGNYSMTFRLTDSGGLTQYWNSGPMPVTVTQGLFAVVLSPTGVDWSSVTPYIEVNVNGQILLPRDPVTSTAYALECGSIQGMIAMFANTCPAGWSEFTAFRGRFPAGVDPANPGQFSTGQTGGQLTHNHGGETGPPNAQSASDAGDHFLSPVGNHIHSIEADSSLPPYLTVVFCQKQ